MFFFLESGSLQFDNLSIYVQLFSVTVTENHSNKGFLLLKTSEFKQWKSFVRIGRNFKAKMA